MCEKIEKLYKFRALASCEDFCRIRDIIKTGKFYFSDWDKMNDPMEGYFSYLNDKEGQGKELADEIAGEKGKYKICSFSDSWDNILMWSHYADNHKGVCIEVEVSEDKVKEITYIEKIPSMEEILNKNQDDKAKTAKAILSTKLNQWEYENEWRVFEKSEFKKVGKITAVYFGLKCEKYKQELEKLCRNKKIPMENVEININDNKLKKR